MSLALDDIKTLVSEGSVLKDKLSRLKKQLDRKKFVVEEAAKPLNERLGQINELLLEQGKGDYLGEKGEKAAVVEPSPTFKPTDEEVEAARVICGDHFGLLFEEKKSFVPNKSFRAVAKALLKEADYTRLIAMCEKPSTAYVKWS